MPPLPQEFPQQYERNSTKKLRGELTRERGWDEEGSGVVDSLFRARGWRKKRKKKKRKKSHGCHECDN